MALWLYPNLPVNGDPPVGAGLLANAQCQSTYPLTDPTHSRASPLPQGDLCWVRNPAGLSGRRWLRRPAHAAVHRRPGRHRSNGWR
ncbi:hypothetical protein C3E98_022390 [Pseudomonas sp. MWU13-2625]|nr:hypothetical protein C3E98_022390 [Pseudomonas sp. MWU13-2625]